MMSAGVGLIDNKHIDKATPGEGMVITKIGGPAYRIGMGGGAASSRVQDDDEKNAELDFNAVQRGDAEMENKMNRVVRACIELGDKNPILSIHDQGAGGNGNVLKEIMEPVGGTIDIRALPIGDPTMSALELWGAEYQENNCLLINAESKELFAAMCERESVPFAFLGTVENTGKVVVVDKLVSEQDEKEGKGIRNVVDLQLEYVLGKLDPRTFTSTRAPVVLKNFKVPKATVKECLDRVFRLVHVGSKRFLTSKVDRCVTGLVSFYTSLY